MHAICHCRIGVFINERWRVEDRMKSERKITYWIKEQIKFAKKLAIEHLFYTISIATNKRTFFKRLWISGHPSSGCDEIRNEFIKAMGYSCQWIISAFGTNDHQHEEVSCIMTSKKRSSMVKDTKAKGYKIVSLVWFILLCALCNHRESRVATDQLDCLATCLSENGLLLKTVSEYVGQTAVNVYLWLPFLFGVHPVLQASTCRHLLQYWIIWMRSGLYRPTGLLFIANYVDNCLMKHVAIKRSKLRRSNYIFLHRRSLFKAQ